MICGFKSAHSLVLGISKISDKQPSLLTQIT